MAKIPKNYLPIGTKIYVNKLTYSVIENRFDNQRGILSSNEERPYRYLTSDNNPYINKPAVIVGATFKKCGWINSSSISYSYYEPEAYISGYLDVKETIFVYIIRFSLLGKENYILPENITEILNINTPIPTTLSSSKQTGTYKLFLSSCMKEEMKNWPRDSKGRWIKNSQIIKEKK